MNDTKYLVYVDDGENKNIHEIFADSVDQAKMIVASNGIPPDNIVKVVPEKNTSSNHTTYKQKEITNPFTGEKILVNSEEESVDDEVNHLTSKKISSSSNNINSTETSFVPSKIYNLNGITIGIINGEMYTQTWVDVASENNESKKEYRIINTKTNKLVNNVNYQIQVKQWVKLPTE